MQDPSAKVTTSPAPRPGGRAYVLRFISGKYQGGEFPIAPEKSVLIGRSSDLEMVLVEDMVSRKHARISLHTPLIPPLRELKADELDVLQLAHNYGVFEAVLNKSLATDLETAEIVMKLLKAQYLRAE